MLETVWYLLVLILQILQVNPQIMTEKLQIDVFVASKPAYSFVVQGNAVAGQVRDAENATIFGEFESTRRLPQAYVIFPLVPLSDEVEAAGMAGMDKGKTGSTGSASSLPATAAAGTKATKASEKKKTLSPLTIDFSKALKQLASFRDKPRQKIEYPEAGRFLASSDGAEKSANTAKTSPSPSAAASPASGEKSAEDKAMIEIHQYSNRLVVTAEFIQTVMIVNFMQ